MITDEELNRLRTESLLSENFVILNDSSNNIFVIFGETIVDIVTFKLIMMWKSYGSSIYKKIFINRKNHIKYLLELNKHDKNISYTSKNNLPDYIYSKFLKTTANISITDIINRYKDQIND